MKFKKMMLITLLLLAVLTIGAVSAAEGDVLAADGENETIVESPVNDKLLESDESSDVLTIAPEDFNIALTFYELDVKYDEPLINFISGNSTSDFKKIN